MQRQANSRDWPSCHRANWNLSLAFWPLSARTDKGEARLRFRVTAKRVCSPIHLWPALRGQVNLKADRYPTLDYDVSPSSSERQEAGRQSGKMEPAKGIEPPTYGLRNRCSTD